MPIDPEKFGALKNAIERARHPDVSTEQKTECTNDNVREALRLGAELLGLVISDLEEIQEDKSYKEHDYSKEELLAHFEKEETRQKFVEQECSLFRIAGWSKSDREQIKELLEVETRHWNLKEVPGLYDFTGDLILINEHLKGVQEGMEQESKNKTEPKISRYLEWFSAKGFFKVLCGGSMVTVNIFAPIDPLLKGGSVTKGIDIAGSGIIDFWKIFEHNTPPPPPPSRIRIGIGYVEIGGIRISRRQ